MNKTLQELLPPQAMAGRFDIDDPAEILHEQTKFHRATLMGQVKNIVRFLRHRCVRARQRRSDNAHPRDFPHPSPLPQAGEGEMRARAHATTTSRNMPASM